MGLSPILWLYVRRLWTWVRPRARFRQFGLEDQMPFSTRAAASFGSFVDRAKLKSRRRLTQEILPANHCTFPVVCHQRRRHYAGIWAFVSNESTKVNLCYTCGPGR